MRELHRGLPQDHPKAHYELCNLPNCVFLSERGTCSKLNVTACLGSRCTFLQTSGDLLKSNACWQKRLASLDEEQQMAISKKYYGGKTPWREKEVSHV